MTKRERVIKALEFKETDYCPHNAWFTEQALENMNGYLEIDNYIDTIDNHIIEAYYSGNTVPMPEKGYFIDDFGVIWNRTGADKDIGVIENIVLKEYEDLDNYIFPEIDEKSLRNSFEKMYENEGQQFRFASIGFSMFERAWTLRGMENLLMDMIIEPEWVENLLTKICDYNLKIMDIALEYDLDGFHFGDDWGQQKGLIMGPQLWRKFIKPQMEKMYKKAKNKGLWISQHSCGDLRDILDDLVEIGLNVYQTVQPEIYDLVQLKEKYNKKLSFWGGISTQRDLASKTPQEIKKIVKETINIMSKNGGYIVSPTHALEFDVPPENIIAMIETFKEN